MNLRHFVSLPLVGTALLGLACGDSAPSSPTAPTSTAPVSGVQQTESRSTLGAGALGGESPGVVTAAAWSLAPGLAQSGPTAPGASATGVAAPGIPTAGGASHAVGSDVAAVASVTGGAGSCGGLKAAAPGAVSPANDQVVARTGVVLTARNARWNHDVPGLASLRLFRYRFELYEGGQENPFLTARQQEGPGDTTTHPVGQPLKQGTRYRWRVVAEYKGRSCSSEVALFRTPAATIGAPTLISPDDRATDVPLTASLRVANGRTSGNVGAVTMRFEVAPNPVFNASQLLRIPHVPAGNRYTSVSIPAGLTRPDTKYYWRVMAQGGREGARIFSPYSEVWSFTTGSGHSDEIDPSSVRWLHTNVSGWAQTSTITRIDINDVPAGGICIHHTQARSWPGINSKLGGVLAGNTWVFAKIDGVWYGATYEWLRPNQICKLQVKGKHKRPALELGPHTKQPPLQGWVPRKGEQVGFMVSTLARFGPEGNRRERSDIKLITWP